MDMLRLWLVAAAFSLAGCASGPTYQDTMESYIGASQDQVIGQWGYPDRRETLPGGEAFIYLRGSTVQMPMMVNHVGNQSYGAGGGTLSRYCRTVFEMNSYGRVSRVSWNGNNCKAR